MIVFEDSSSFHLGLATFLTQPELGFLFPSQVSLCLRWHVHIYFCILSSQILIGFDFD